MHCMSTKGQISETRQSRFALLATPQLFPPLFASLHTSSNQLSLSAIATTTTSHLSSASNLLQSYAPGAKRPHGSASPAPPPQLEEDPGPDSRDVDRILGELVALGGRWALFRRFVWGRIAVSRGRIRRTFELIPRATMTIRPTPSSHRPMATAMATAMAKPALAPQRPQHRNSRRTTNWRWWSSRAVRKRLRTCLKCTTNRLSCGSCARASRR